MSNRNTQATFSSGFKWDEKYQLRHHHHHHCRRRHHHDHHYINHQVPWGRRGDHWQLHIQVPAWVIVQRISIESRYWRQTDMQTTIIILLIRNGQFYHLPTFSNVVATGQDGLWMTEFKGGVLTSEPSWKWPQLSKRSWTYSKINKECQCHHNYHHQRLCWLPSWRRTTHPGPSLSSARRRGLAISSSLQGWSSSSWSSWHSENNEGEGGHWQICCSGCSLEGRSSPQRSGFK